MTLELTDAERESALWKKLVEHWEEKLKAYRLENDGDLTKKRTNRLRGKIAEVKLNLSLGEVEQEVKYD